MTRPTTVHIAAGAFFVGERQETQLKAYLGTCLGVIIVDDTAGVAGMMHLLLPKPIASEGHLSPDKYASLGIPRFIEALEAAGARPDQMQARLAGGALVGPVNHQDLHLDIGGRTAEVTKSLLDDAGIQIDHLETGGFFTCQVSLDMTTFESIVEPIGFEESDATVTVEPPTRDAILLAMDRLQPIPQVALKILRIIDQDDFDILQIANELRHDQVIGARTLKLCNASAFAKSQRIDSIDHALVFLGKEMFVKMVVLASVKHLFDSASGGYSLCKGGIYHHAVGAAMIAEALALEFTTMPPAVAYTAGLLHDIGKVVLDQHIAEGYPMFYRQVNEADRPFIEIEQELLGINHTQVGELLGERWTFPTVLVDVIRHHHFPETATANTELVHIVHLADLLMARFSAGLELERHNTEALVTRLQRLGLTTDDWPRLVDLIPNSVFDSTESLGLAAS